MKPAGYYWAKYGGECDPEIVLVTAKNEVYKIGCSYDFELGSWELLSKVEPCEK